MEAETTGIIFIHSTGRWNYNRKMNVLQMTLYFHFELKYVNTVQAFLAIRNDTHLFESIQLYPFILSDQDELKQSVITLLML